MRKKGTKLLGMMITMSLLLSGCGNWKNYFYTEADLKREAAEALEEKYGEEFVVHRVWERSQRMFYATCSPKEDESVIFDADIYKDGRGVVVDGYAQGIVGNEVKEKLIEDFQQLYEDCYVRVDLLNYYNVPEFENVQDITLEEYSSQVTIDVISVDVFILLSEVSEDTIEEEYAVFSGKIQDMVNAGEIPNVLIQLHFVDEEMMATCKEYYAIRTTYGSNFKEQLDEYFEIYFSYKDNKISKTYEEYKELRMEVGTNE